MSARIRRSVGLAMVLMLFAANTRSARADEIENKAIEAGVGIAIAAAAITVAVVLVVTHKPSITGCVSEGPGGLTIASEGDSKTYVLHGDIASIAPGQRVRVSGKSKKGATPAEFDVAKLKKTFGACPAHG